MIHESQKLKEKREKKKVRWERIKQKVPQPNNDEDCKAASIINRLISLFGWGGRAGQPPHTDTVRLASPLTRILFI